MKSKSYLLHFYITLIALVVMGSLQAQTPVINSLDKTFAPVNDTLTLSGSGFGNAAANININFGSVNGSIARISDTQIEAIVPSGVTFSSISVTNTTSGLTGYSSDLFFISFGGTTWDPTLFSGPTTFVPQTGIFDLCMCDFDGNGESDLATSHTGSTQIDIFRNTSTLAAVSFNKTSVTVGENTLNVTCKDIDGDGLPDLVASRDAANSIYIWRNTSSVGSISFGTVLELNTTGSMPRKVVIRDLNLDGRPELIASNRSSVNLSIFRNLSTPGTISFGPEVPFGLPVTALNSSGLAVEDLTGDGKPEVIVNPFLNANIYIFQNNSTPGGAVSFRPVALFNVSGNLSHLVVGDLDGDDKPDIAVSRFLSSDISILLNETTNSTAGVSFAAPKIVSTLDQPLGMDLGDLDGDGLADLALASSSDNLQITLLRNISTLGDFSFERFDINIGDKSQNIKIGDINGDAKPDIAYTGTQNNRLGVLLNGNCHLPTITPAGPITLCSGNTIRLSAVGAIGVTYRWFLDGALTGVTTSFIDATASGDYTVEATSQGGTCVEVSQPATITVIGGGAGAPSATDNGPVCPGADLELFTPDVAGATFSWTGPNGFSSNLQNPVRSNFVASMVGVYQVQVTLGACTSGLGSTTVSESMVPDFTITTADPVTFCQGKSATLSIPGAAGLSYQWFLDGSTIAGAVTTTHSAVLAGTYTVESTNSDNCSRLSSAMDIAIVPPPTAGYSSADEACIDLAIGFTNTSVFDTNENVFYEWDFGDGNTSTVASPTHTYTVLGNYNVSLLVHYDDVDCNDTFSKMINVVNSPTVAITADRDTIMCEGDTINLSVENIHSAYNWSTGASINNIQVTAAGIYSVDVTTTSGCVATASVEVVTLPLPDIMVTADIDQIFAGDTVQLNASGGINYSWSPTEGLSDPNLENPIANPVRTTTYTVTADGPNGCFGTASITIQVGEGINVSPKPLFSPNNDGQNDLWVIENIERYPDCTVLVFNRQGNVIYERRPYFGNEWDGTYGGQPVIEGGYYFVIRCEGSSKNAATGSITLIR